MTVSINKLKKSIDAIINPKYKVKVMKETEKRFDYINPNDIPLIIVSLCNLKNAEKKKFSVCHLKLTCERNDFAFLLFLVDFLSNEDNFRTVIPLSDEEIEQIYLPMIEPIYTKWTIDEINMYDEILKKYNLSELIKSDIFLLLKHKKIDKK